MEKRKILVVEDEHLQAWEAAETLRELGYEVCGIVACGRDALEAVRRQRPDLILMDVGLEGDMDGVEAAQRIQSIADIPVVYLTGHSEAALVERAKGTYPYAYLLKPFDNRELRIAIDLAFYRADMERQLREAYAKLDQYSQSLEAEVNRRTRHLEKARRALAHHAKQLEAANQRLSQEVVERARAQEALAESERRFRGIVETARDCVFIKDPSLRYTLVNRAMCDLMGLPETEIVGKTDTELFGAVEGEHLRSVDRRVLGGEVIEEIHARLVQGALLTFLDIKTPLAGSNGEIVGICGIAREVTERRTLAKFHVPSTVEYRSDAMRSALSAAQLAAASDTTILLTGDSGTGKDFLARYIHGRSERSAGPFYAINCAAIPSELAESELFGYEAGAFTGAKKSKRGLIELAEGGTILLNEVGEMPLLLQAKLLAFLDTKSFTRVGGEEAVAVNVRLLAATNRDLFEEVRSGRFRRDLFYRLNVFSIRLPTLSERLDDLPALVEELVVELSPVFGYAGRARLDKQILAALRRYSWPGNVRELRNAIERALIISRGGPLKLKHFSFGENPLAAQKWQPTFPMDQSLPDLLKEIERSCIKQALRHAGGKKADAAKLLSISRFVLMRHMTALGVD